MKQILYYTMLGILLWQNYGSTDEDEKIKKKECTVRSVRETRDSGYIVAGDVSVFDNNFWRRYYTFLIKVDSNGNKLWDKSFDNVIANSCFVRETKDGGYLIFSVAYNDPPKECNYWRLQSDIWLIKVDSNGNKLWDHLFEGKLQHEEPKGVVETPEVGYVIVWDRSPYEYSKSDIWLIKVDSNGNKLWNHSFGIGSYVYLVKERKDSGYIIVVITGGINISDGINIYGINVKVTIIKLSKNGNKEN